MWRLVTADSTGTWAQVNAGLVDTASLTSIAVPKPGVVIVASPSAGVSVTHTGGL